MTSVGKPKFVIEAAISVGVTSRGLYLTSAFAASKAIKTFSTPEKIIYQLNAFSVIFDALLKLPSIFLQCFSMAETQDPHDIPFI